MPLGLMASVIEAIAGGPEGGPSASMSIAGLDPEDLNKAYKKDGVDLSERAFQYWPESISDAISIGWEPKSVTGGSHAFLQWSQNSGRIFSFDVNLTRFTMPVDTRSTLEKLKSASQRPDSQNPIDNRPYNVNVREQIKFLRAFCYPTYKDIGGVISSLPPPIAVLYMPNMGLNEDGSDVLYAVMTGCDVTYRLLFRDGTPRAATVSLSFTQVVQTKDGVRFVGFGEGAPTKYNMDDREKMDKNAGRKLNGMKDWGVYD
ncbi:MAG: hypothetical protein PHI12_14105 [Dehalococcoidales bacterium]|nr:hypothetical protein [Dehalococcoidales bacterium]